MGRKCCVTECRGNYDKNHKATVFRLPSAKTNPHERKRWLQVIPRDNTPDSKDTSVCIDHWPKGFKTVMVHGKVRPRNPPSIFPNIPLSMLPTPADKPRTTTRTSLEVRTSQEDELNAFVISDKISFDFLISSASKRKFVSPVTCYIVNDMFYMQSCSFFTDCVPMFLLKISTSLKFQAYHAGVRCHITSLSKNRITELNGWSKVEEAIRFLDTTPIEQKKKVIKEQLDVMGPSKVGTKVYNEDTILRVFEYSSISRSCYERFRTDYKLLSVKTLTKLTSKVSKLDDGKFLSHVFSTLALEQQKCIILVDEVYVKPSLRYHGGEVFGQVLNNPKLLANTVLAIMVKCLFGGPTFLLKMIPVAKLNSEFLYEQVTGVMDVIDLSGGKVVSVITDNNRTNQAFFKKFKTVKDKPWLTVDGLFLLFDYVHLLRSVRNNWLTEACQELNFECDGEILLAKWSDLIELYNLEKENLVSISSLTEVAVYPKPIERQKVSICLKVFCDKTVVAFKTNSSIDQDNVHGTVTFLEKILSFWKIVSNKEIKGEERHRTIEKTYRNRR